MGLAGGIAISLGATVWRVSRSSDAEQWDVVIVTFDTTRADRIGYHGHHRGRTPELDALARDGVAYLRCYTPAPVTLPAHCSLMTGLTPLRHGVHDNGTDALAAEAKTLAELLSEQGYATGAFVGAFVLDRRFGLAQGFGHYSDDMTGGREADQFCYAERSARLVTDAALDWLANRPDGPVFVWIHYFDPHFPYEAPQTDRTFSALSAYDAEINFADSQLQRIVDHFDKHEGRPALMLVAGDHGEGLGDHGEATHGMFAYNSTLHVPLVVRFPDRAHRATRIEEAVSLVDVLPSIVHWLGLPVPPDVDGRPLPLIDKPRATDRGLPRGIYFENYFVLSNYGWSPLVGAVWDDLKYIQAPRAEVYDLTRDADERRPLEVPGQQATLQKRLDSLVGDLQSRGIFAAQAIELAAPDVSTLESLGYAGSRVGEGGSPAQPASLPDPKDMVDVLAKLQSAALAMEQQSTKAAVDDLIDVVSKDDPGNPRAVKMLAAISADASRERPRILDSLLQTRERTGRSYDIQSLAVLGVGLFSERKYEDCIGIFTEVVERVPNHAAAYRYLGDAHRELNQLAEAARSYRRAVELAGGLDDPPAWLGQVQRELAAISGEGAARE
jgi:arylsulfatase A-like enzyme